MITEIRPTAKTHITIVSAWHELAGIEAEVTEWVEDAQTGKTIGAWVIVTASACMAAGKNPTNFAQRIGADHPIFISNTEIARAQDNEDESAA